MRPEFEDLPFFERPNLTPYLIHLTKIGSMIRTTKSKLYGVAPQYEMLSLRMQPVPLCPSELDAVGSDHLLAAHAQFPFARQAILELPPHGTRN